MRDDRRSSLAGRMLPVTAAIGIAFAMLAAPPARAQTYPDRPIKLVVPYAPGGVNDAAARPLAEKLQAKLGTVVVENIAGGGTTIGAATVARAKPDGYTLLLGGQATHVVAPLAAAKAPYDPLKDFEPIIVMALTATGIVVNPKLPVASLKDLAAHVRTHAKTLTYASPGTGSPGHLSFERFKQLIGVNELAHVPYRGSAPAMNDVIAGHVPMMMPSMTGQVMQLDKAGEIKLLAVTAPKRLTALPDVPTAEEAGILGLVNQSFVALFAPAGTPREIVDRIAAATRQVLAEGAFKEALTASGFEPVEASGPDQARAFVAAEIERWTPLVKSLDLKN